MQVRWESLEFEFPVEMEVGRKEAKMRAGDVCEVAGDGGRRKLSLPPISTLVAEIDGSLGNAGSRSLTALLSTSPLGTDRGIQFATDTARKGAMRESSKSLRWVPVGVGSRAYRRSQTGRETIR